MEIAVELLLEILGDVLVELAIVSLGEAAANRSRNPALAVLGMGVFGTLVGFLSIWPLPHHLIQSPTARVVSLFFTPLFLGFLLGGRGWLKTVPRFAWRSFFRGILLAGAFGAVRFFFAT